MVTAKNRKQKHKLTTAIKNVKAKNIIQLLSDPTIEPKVKIITDDII